MQVEQQSTQITEVITQSVKRLVLCVFIYYVNLGDFSSFMVSPPTIPKIIHATNATVSKIPLKGVI